MARLDAIASSLAILGIAISQVGCSAHACSAVGTEDGVSIDFYEPAIVMATEVNVTVCVDGKCVTRMTRGGDDHAPKIVFVSLPVSADANLRIAVRALASNQSLFVGTRRVHSHKFDPNGPGCGPTVRQVHLRADGEKHLSLTRA